jgi:hypothetical protein
VRHLPCSSHTRDCATLVTMNQYWSTSHDYHAGITYREVDQESESSQSSQRLAFWPEEDLWSLAVQTPSA